MIVKVKKFFVPTLIVFFAISISILGGCAKKTSANIATGTMMVSEGGDTVSSSKLIFTDKKLDKKLSLGEIKMSQESGAISFQATITNMKKSTVPFEYRIKWMDKNGINIDYPTQLWHPMLANGREEVYINGVAPDDRAVSFQIHVRRPNPVK